MYFRPSCCRVVYGDRDVKAVWCADTTDVCFVTFSSSITHRVVYGDRDVQATLQRLSQNMDMQQLLRMATGRGLPEPPAVGAWLWFVRQRFY